MKSKWLLAEILVGLASSYFIMTTYFSGDRKFEDLALGTETVTYNAVDENRKPIHIQRSNEEESTRLLEAWKERGSKPVILFLGNSQTHSINQQKEGEINFIEILYKNRTNQQEDIVCISLPNAGLQEFYLTYKYWNKVLPIKAIVVPVFMDDLREDGIRDVFFAELIATKFQLSDTADNISQKINKELRLNWTHNLSVKQLVGELDKLDLPETLQEKSETYLNGQLENRSKAWVNRPNVRGEFFNGLYKLRNTVFGIKASTIRKMIPQRYKLNMHALELLTDDCVVKGKKVILYIPPIRSDVVLPYNENEYQQFKIEVEKLAIKNPQSVYFKNYETILPGKLWGYKAATSLNSEKEIDYMHFQFKGHQILADSLHVILNQAIYPHGI